MLKKILVPIDSIEWDNTLNAVEKAVEFSRGCSINGGPELIFLHVFHSKSRVPMSEKERLNKLKSRRMEEEFETVRKLCEEKGMGNVTTLMEEGDPKEKILEIAEDKDVDMIVMGSGKLQNGSAQARIGKFVYGSVTEGVIHEASCSVLVARPGE